MVMQDTAQKAKQAMPLTRRMMWIGFAIHPCASHSVHSPDAPFGGTYLRIRRIGRASKLNLACFSHAEGAGCSATHAAWTDCPHSVTATSRSIEPTGRTIALFEHLRPTRPIHIRTEGSLLMMNRNKTIADVARLTRSHCQMGSSSLAM